MWSANRDRESLFDGRLSSLPSFHLLRVMHENLAILRSSKMAFVHYVYMIEYRVSAVPMHLDSLKSSLCGYQF